MINENRLLTGVERTYTDDQMLVSKTNPRGVITYANTIFVQLSGYSEDELLGRPHNLIRHPDMPRCVFKLLWDTIEQKKEIFAYVINLSKNGDHYWVLAHVTATLDSNGQIISYHSNRRRPEPSAIAAISPIYKTLRDIEKKYNSNAEGMAKATETLLNVLEQKEVSYEQFVLSL